MTAAPVRALLDIAGITALAAAVVFGAIAVWRLRRGDGQVPAALVVVVVLLIVVGIVALTSG